MQDIVAAKQYKERYDFTENILHQELVKKL